MFNIRSLVNRISQVKDGETAETSPNKSRAQSQTSATSIDDGTVPVEAEGFLCPSCMTAFGSPDDLQSHYQNDHLDPGANYLCPVCKARLNTSEELELHFSANHSSSSIKSGDIETLVKQIGDLTSSLSEERCHSQELCKELEQLKEMLQAQGTSDEQKMYQQQLLGLQESKTILTTEVGLLSKQLTESLASLIQLKQDKEKVEAKAAGFAQQVAELQAYIDDNNSLVTGLKENIQELRLQLNRQLNNEDAESQIKELTSAQKLAEEIIAAKDRELQEMQRTLAVIQSQSAVQQPVKDEALYDSFNEQLRSLEAKNRSLENEIEQHVSNIQNLEQLLLDRNEQLQSLQHVREETDVCVGHLRQEVTSLQEMLSEARHEAEDQVSAKDDELFKFKQDFLKQEKQIVQLEEQNHGLKKSNDNMAKDLAQQRKTIEDRDQVVSRMKEDINQLEEKVSRLESEKQELLENTEKGEGMINTAIHQLQQENERLQEEITKTKGNLVTVEHQAKANVTEWSRTEQQLQEKLKLLEDKLKISDLELQKLGAKALSLEDCMKRKDSELKDIQAKFSNSEKARLDLETLNKQKDDQLEKCFQENNIVQRDLQSEKEKNTTLLKAHEALQMEMGQRDKQLAELQEERERLIKICKHLEDVRKELNESQEKINTLNGVKEKLEDQLNQYLLRLESTEKTCQDREGEISSLNLILQESQNRISQFEKLMGEKERIESQQQARIAELEPLMEALEQEKMRRIKEKAEWGEHEQLLRSEKEALATLVTHLQQQLDELSKEHQFHLHRLKTESEILLKENNSLAEQLNIEKERRAKDLTEWQIKGSKLEEDAKSLTAKLKTTSDLSAARYQRCEELQASSEKYLSLKLELEAKVSVLEEEKLELQNNCSQWETEVDRLKFNAVELRRRLEDSQAALHELGRENQSLQMENAKLMGRKWADDSEVDDCHNCHKGFNITVRKHHCRNCGQIFCNECSCKSAAVGNSKKPVRVCDSCYKELNVNPSR